jgi:hypothetical protein
MATKEDATASQLYSGCSITGGDAGVCGALVAEPDVNTSYLAGACYGNNMKYGPACDELLTRDDATAKNLFDACHYNPPSSKDELCAASCSAGNTQHCNN